jgi:hypothetical protein
VSAFDYTDVKIGARRDEATGRLVVSALVDGVEVPLVVQKLGLFSEQLDAAQKQRADAAQTPGTSTVG